MAVEFAHQDTPHGQWKLLGYQHISKNVWVVEWYSPSGRPMWGKRELSPGILRMFLIEKIITLLTDRVLKQI